MLWAFLRTIWPNRFRSRSESSFELPIQLDNFGTAVGGCGSTDNLCTRRTLYRERRILQKSSSKNDFNAHIIISPSHETSTPSMQLNMPKSPQPAYSRPQPPLYNTSPVHNSASEIQHTVSGSHFTRNINPDFLFVVCTSNYLNADSIAIIVGQQVRIIVDGELTKALVVALAGRQHCYNLFDVVGTGRFAGRVGTLATHISQPYLLSDPWDDSALYPLVISDTNLPLFTYIPSRDHFYVTVLHDSPTITQILTKNYPRPDVYCVERST